MGQIIAMKKYLVIVVLITLYLQSWTTANEIDEFSIEDISIGDSLLSYFSVNEINNAPKNYYPNSKKYIGVQFKLNNYEIYEYIQVHFKDDNNFIVSSIVGGEFFKNIKDCYNKQNIIEKDLSEVFPNTSPRRGKTTFPDDVESTLINVEFNLPKFDIVVSCTDWSKKSEALGNTDSLRVEISSLEFSNFLRDEAY